MFMIAPVTYTSAACWARTLAANDASIYGILPLLFLFDIPVFSNQSVDDADRILDMTGWLGGASRQNFVFAHRAKSLCEVERPSDSRRLRSSTIWGFWM